MRDRTERSQDVAERTVKDTLELERYDFRLGHILRF